MPGDTLQFALPAAESGKVYAPAQFAWRIENLSLTPDGTLASVRGPAPLIPDRGAGYPYSGRVHGVFHALLDGGQRSVLLIRHGTVLSVFAGYDRGLSTLATGLSDDPYPTFPDQFVEVAGKVVWSNGVDAAIVYDGYTHKTLGHTISPGALTVLGPQDDGHQVFRNRSGYSHPGKIGVVGDFFDVDQGAMLDAVWTYYVQLEDVFGDLSPLSPGTPAHLRQEYTSGVYWDNYEKYPTKDDFTTNQVLGERSVNFDDLTRQFCIVDAPLGQSGIVARWYWRTAANDPTPRFLARVADRVSTVFPDNTPDALLGVPSDEYTTVPRFHLACSYKGCLVALEETGQGLRVRISDPNQPGTFKRTSYVDIDTKGARATGAVSFGGALYIFTTKTMFPMVVDADGVRTADQVYEGFGCAAPASIQTTDDGVLTWMGTRAWFAMVNGEPPARISGGEEKLFLRLNQAALSRSVAVWCAETQEYICWVPDAGALGCALGMAWDGAGWRRYRLGVEVASACVTRDPSNTVLLAGKAGTQDNVWAFLREVYGYAAPTKTYRYQSAWVRVDPTGRTTFNADLVYVGFVESSNQPITWKAWKDDNRDILVGSGTITPVDPSTAELLGSVVIGTGKFHHPRLTWWCFDTRLVDVRSFAFDLACTEPGYMNIAAFAFDVHTVDEAGARVNRS